MASLEDMLKSGEIKVEEKEEEFFLDMNQLMDQQEAMSIYGKSKEYVQAQWKKRWKQFKELKNSGELTGDLEEYCLTMEIVMEDDDDKFIGLVKNQQG